MKIFNYLLSIFIFFASFIIIYSSLYFYFSEDSKVENHINKIKLTDKLNIELNKDNYFINNVNNTYLDLANMNYSYSEIKKIENKTNINLVNSEILNNNISFLKGKNKLERIYTKSELDDFLTTNIRDNKIKDYIVSNDYKVIQFETRVNKMTDKFYNKFFKYVKVIFNKKVFIGLSVILLGLVLILVIMKKYLHILISFLSVNIFNIILNIVGIILLNTKLDGTIISYFFDNYILRIIRLSMIISIFVSLLSIICIIIYMRKNDHSKKVKPRIRKVIKDEENFSFGLW